MAVVVLPPPPPILLHLLRQLHQSSRLNPKFTKPSKRRVVVEEEEGVEELEEEGVREVAEEALGVRVKKRGVVRRTRDLGLSLSTTRWWRSRLSRRRSSATTLWTSTSLARRPRLRKEMVRGGRARRSQAAAGKSRDL